MTTFQFDAYGANKTESSDRPQVDWAAMNKYIVEAVQCENEEVLVGVISGIYDLGIQEQKPGEYVFEGDESAEREEIAANPTCHFETRARFYDNGKWLENVRIKVVPKKDAQSVAFAVDFPDVIVDKGSFFGESNPLPYRMLLGGEFILKGGTAVVAAPQALTIRKNDKTGNQWSMMPNSTIYKMAVGAKLVKPGEPFLPERLGELLGKALQFKIRVGFNDAGYLQEKCAFAAGLGRGQVAPQFDKSILHGVTFNRANDPNALKQLRKSVKNTIQRAKNYEGSVIAGELGDTEPTQTAPEVVAAQGNTSVAPTTQNAPKAAVEASGGFDDFDDSIPF